MLGMARSLSLEFVNSELQVLNLSVLPAENKKLHHIMLPLCLSTYFIYMQQSSEAIEQMLYAQHLLSNVARRLDDDRSLVRNRFLLLLELHLLCKTLFTE